MYTNVFNSCRIEATPFFQQIWNSIERSFLRVEVDFLYTKNKTKTLKKLKYVLSIYQEWQLPERVNPLC